MALLITSKCINCDMCVAECPNEAISMGMEIYEINVQRCTECVGHYTHATCQRVCPIENTIIIHPEHIETKEQLKERFQQLHPNKPFKSLE